MSYKNTQFWPDPSAVPSADPSVVPSEICCNPLNMMTIFADPSDPSEKPHIGIWDECGSPLSVTYRLISLGSLGSRVIKGEKARNSSDLADPSDLHFHWDRTRIALGSAALPASRSQTKREVL